MSGPTPQPRTVDTPDGPIWVVGAAHTKLAWRPVPEGRQLWDVFLVGYDSFDPRGRRTSQWMRQLEECGFRLNGRRVVGAHQGLMEVLLVVEGDEGETDGWSATEEISADPQAGWAAVATPTGDPDRLRAALGSDDAAQTHEQLHEMYAIQPVLCVDVTPVDVLRYLAETWDGYDDGELGWLLRQVLEARAKDPEGGRWWEVAAELADKHSREPEMALKILETLVAD